MPTNGPRNRTSLRTPEHGVRRSTESPGYETTDVNVGGIVVFLAGLFGFLVIFFVFCFVMGKVINDAIAEGGRAGQQVAPVSDLPARRRPAASGRT